MDKSKNDIELSSILLKYYEKFIFEKEDQKFIDLYDQSKKKDDLSDSYLQGIYYLNKRV